MELGMPILCKIVQEKEPLSDLNHFHFLSEQLATPWSSNPHCHHEADSYLGHVPVHVPGCRHDLRILNGFAPLPSSLAPLPGLKNVMFDPKLLHKSVARLTCFRFWFCGIIMIMVIIIIVIIIIIALLPSSSPRFRQPWPWHPSPLQWRCWPAWSWQVSLWASGCGDRVLRCTQIRAWWAWSKNALSQLSLSQLSVFLRVWLISYDFWFSFIFIGFLMRFIYFLCFLFLKSSISYDFYRFPMILMFFYFHRCSCEFYRFPMVFWFSSVFCEFYRFHMILILFLFTDFSFEFYRFPMIFDSL